MSQDPLQRSRIGENVYVYDIASSSSNEDIAASLSNHTLCLLDANYFAEKGRLQPHKGTISCIEYSPSNPHLLSTASIDRTVAVWDTRQENATITFTFAEEALAVTSSLKDTLLATACGTAIYFHDMRSNKAPLGSYSDCHTDLITSLHFNRTKPSVLMSAGEDGLVCMFDTAVTSEKEAVTSILNVDCPLRRVGYFGQNDEGIFCLTNTETCSFWHYPSAQRMGNFGSVRTDIEVDYLVNCVHSRESDDVFLLSGRYSGEIAVSLVEPQGIVPITTLRGGHEDVVRCACTIAGGPGERIATGGEDGVLCLWDAATIFHSTHADALLSSKKKRKLEN